jgi:uracil-DNA glycosylase family 4
VCVPGRGNGRVLIVGQNPDGREDASNTVFVGRVGSLLTEMLADAGFSSNDYTLTNAVKCKSPENRKPELDEIKACQGYLKDEIQRLRPTKIIALGEIALRSLVGPVAIARARGKGLPLNKEFEYECEVWTTYHPRFVLKVPKHRNTVVVDLRRARDSDKPREVVDWSWATPGLYTPNAADGPIALDIETNYDYATKKGGETVTQLGWSVMDGRTYVSRDVRQYTQAFKDAQVITHNGWDFDIPHLQAMGYSIPYGWDTMVMAYLDDESQPLNLEALSVKYLGVRGWKDERTAEQGSDEFALYNARDASYTLRLYRELARSLGDRIRIADKIILPARLALNHCTERGVYINPEAVKKAQAHYESLLEKQNTRIRALLPSVSNPNSNREVGTALVESGIHLPTTPSGQFSVGKETLAKVEQTPAVKAVRAQRLTQKRVSSYVKPYAKVVGVGDGRAHPPYTIIRTATGRTSSWVQTLPRDTMLRDFFGAPNGRVLWQSDYSALEFRGAAFVAGEQGIIERYRENPAFDPHIWFAARFYGLAEDLIDKLMRATAKSANFGLLYMATWQTLQEYALKVAGLHLTDDEAKAIRRMWHEVFPGFASFYASTWDTLLNYGYIETITGRRRHFGQVQKLNESERRAALREAVNTQVQGPCSDVALLGLGACDTAELDTVLFWHDAVWGESPIGVNRIELEQTLNHCMIDEPIRILKEDFGIDWNMPLQIEVKYVEASLQA